MLELVAYIAQEEHWREAIANGEEKKLGSLGKEDPRVPPDFRSDFVAPDPAISGWHVTMRRFGERLHVARRLEPKPTSHPVIYHGVPNDAFELEVGEEFTIEASRFRFKWEKNEESRPSGMTLWFTRSELSKKDFGQGGIAFDSLKELSVLGQATSAEQAAARIVKLLTQKLPGARGAALLDRVGIGQDAIVRVQEPINVPFPYSKHLLNDSLNQRSEAIAHDYRDTSSQRNYSMKDAGITWAVVSPVPNSEYRLALYVVGKDDKADSSSARHKQYLEQAVMFVDLAASVLGQVMQNRRLELQKKRLLGFPPKVFKRLLPLEEDPYREQTKPRVCPVTVFFCDLRGFSQFAEDNADDLRVSSQKVLQALNEITKCVVAHDGVIGDLQGDAVMAFWGWPGTMPDQVLKAAKAARDVAYSFSQNQALRSTAFNCGVGLAHGDALVGLMEIAHQAKINIYGPVVNRAARLESLTKRFKVQILVDENMKRELERKGDEMELAFRAYPSVRLAGMTQPGPFFELYMPDDAAHELRPAANFWERALQSFADGDWKTTRDLISRSFQNRPADSESDPGASWLLTHMEHNQPKPGEKQIPSLEK